MLVVSIAALTVTLANESKIVILKVSVANEYNLRSQLTFV